MVASIFSCVGSPLNGSGRHPRALVLASKSLCVIALAVLACADVLGIPGDPQLVNEPAIPGPDAPPGNTVGEAPPIGSMPRGEGGSGVSPEEIIPSPTPPAPAPLASDAAVPEQEPADAGSVPPEVPPELSDATDNGGCGVGQSLGPNGRCFVLQGALLSWSDARASCQALGQGWDLTSIRSAEVDQFLAGLITTEAWIGASDAALEGTWSWVDDGSAFWTGNSPDGMAVGGAYAHWNATEPNGGVNTNCARIVPSVGNAWADLDCGSLLAALCQGPPP